MPNSEAPKTTGGRSKGKTVCVFLGTDRLAKMKRRGQQLGFESFSEYISALGDAGLDLTAEDMRQLRALATIKRVNLSSLVAQMVRKAGG